MNSQLFGQKQEPNAAPRTRIEILKNKDNVAVLRAAGAGKTNSLQGYQHISTSSWWQECTKSTNLRWKLNVMQHSHPYYTTKDPQRQSTDFWYTKRSKSLHS